MFFTDKENALRCIKINRIKTIRYYFKKSYFIKKLFKIF